MKSGGTIHFARGPLQGMRSRAQSLGPARVPGDFNIVSSKFRCTHTHTHTAVVHAFRSGHLEFAS